LQIPQLVSIFKIYKEINQKLIAYLDFMSESKFNFSFGIMIPAFVGFFVS